MSGKWRGKSRKPKKLVKNLSHDNPIVRCAALAALTARFVPEEVFPFCREIAKCLEDETWEVRVAACQTFRELGTPRFRRTEEEADGATDGGEAAATATAAAAATAERSAAIGSATAAVERDDVTSLKLSIADAAAIQKIDLGADPPRNPAQLRLWILARAGKPRRPLRAVDASYNPDELMDIDELRGECEARGIESEGFAPMLRMRLNRHAAEMVYRVSV